MAHQQYHMSSTGEVRLILCTYVLDVMLCADLLYCMDMNLAMHRMCIEM